MLTIAPHPLLDLVVLRTRWPTALGGLPSPDWLVALASIDAPSPFAPPDDGHKALVRDLLRHGGFKPAGRSKPCNEYIRGATAEGRFPLVNGAVDATNLAALHGGLPVSTVDADRLTDPLEVRIADPGARYVFNAAGQTIDLSGLLCLCDADGPCANAVKDAQRAKTDDGTTTTLTLVWGTRTLPGRAEAVAAWLSELCANLGGAPAVVASGP